MPCVRNKGSVAGSRVLVFLLMRPWVSWYSFRECFPVIQNAKLTFPLDLLSPELMVRFLNSLCVWELRRFSEEKLTTKNVVTDHSVRTPVSGELISSLRSFLQEQGILRLWTRAIQSRSFPTVVLLLSYFSLSPLVARSSLHAWHDSSSCFISADISGQNMHSLACLWHIHSVLSLPVASSGSPHVHYWRLNHPAPFGHPSALYMEGLGWTLMTFLWLALKDHFHQSLQWPNSLCFLSDFFSSWIWDRHTACHVNNWTLGLHILGCWHIILKAVRPGTCYILAPLAADFAVISVVDASSCTSYVEVHKLWASSEWTRIVYAWLLCTWTIASDLSNWHVGWSWS